MTNGEKFQQIFAVSQVDECDLNVYTWLPCHDAIEIPLEWWNANYSEIPTGSTDCISRQAVIDLMMQKWGENFSGDDAMQESIDAIRELPSVTPQEPTDKKFTKADIDAIVKAINTGWELRVNEILDKVIDEIEQYQSDYDVHGTEYDRTAWKAFNRCLQIIDKYKVEIEQQESEDKE